MRLTQQKILSYIQAEISKKGYPPTIREIGVAVGLSSSSTVHGHLIKLEEKGLISRDPSKPRTIDLQPITSLSDNGEETDCLPVLKTITQEAPTVSSQNIDYFFPLKKGKFQANSFMLKINGNSMDIPGIIEGDLIIVNQQADAIDGDIVVAFSDSGQVIVINYMQEVVSDFIKPMDSGKDSSNGMALKIVGKVVGVIRQLHQSYMVPQ